MAGDSSFMEIEGKSFVWKEGKWLFSGVVSQTTELSQTEVLF